MPLSVICAPIDDVSTLPIIELLKAVIIKNIAGKAVRYLALIPKYSFLSGNIDENIRSK